MSDKTEIDEYFLKILDKKIKLSERLKFAEKIALKLGNKDLLKFVLKEIMGWPTAPQNLDKPGHPIETKAIINNNNNCFS